MEKYEKAIQNSPPERRAGIEKEFQAIKKAFQEKEKKT